jgi:hypothetical protein
MTHSHKPTIMVDVTYHDQTPGPVTGIGLTVDYTGGISTVSLLDFPPLSDEDLQRAVREKLVQLADALKEGTILWHPRNRTTVR